MPETRRIPIAIERQDLKEIVAAVAEAGIEEFSLELGDVKVRLRKCRPPASAAAPGTPARAAAERPPASTSSEASATAVAASSDSARGVAAPRAAVEPIEESLVAVRAPLIGTFYRAPAPDAPPFVEVGSVVEPDETVCIVEVMKLMNGVRAGCHGRVARICVENATLVEYGQTLMLIDPAP